MLRLYCTECGQCLELAGGQLLGKMRCPRCATEHEVSALVSKDTPLQVDVTPNAPPALTRDAPRPETRGPEYAELNGQSRQSTGFDPAALGIDAATTGVGLFGRAAFWIDDKLYGWRRFLFTVLALVTAVAYGFGPLWYFVGLLSLALAGYIYLLARVWGLRDEDGNWRWAYVLTRIKAWFGGLAEFSLPPLAAMVRSVGAWLMSIGLFVLALSPAVVALAAALSDVFGEGIKPSQYVSWHRWLAWPAGLIAFFGLLLYMRWWLRMRGSAGQLRAALRGNEGLYFDAWRDSVDSYTEDPGLRRVLHALRTWRPRRCQSEADYELSLVRHLVRMLPDVSIQTQRPVHYANLRVGKIDVVIADWFALELKKRVKATEADRAVGQVWKYAETWGRGPVGLLLCESTGDGIEQLMAERLAQLRSQGRQVLLIAAGARR